MFVTLPSALNTASAGTEAGGAAPSAKLLKKKVSLAPVRWLAKTVVEGSVVAGHCAMSAGKPLLLSVASGDDCTSRLSGGAPEIASQSLLVVCHGPGSEAVNRPVQVA